MSIGELAFRMFHYHILKKQTKSFFSDGLPKEKVLELIQFHHMSVCYTELVLCLAPVFGFIVSLKLLSYFIISELGDKDMEHKF